MAAISGIDLRENPNQAAFFNTVLRKLNNPESIPAKVFTYGGAIRGGKTYVCLFIGMVICKMYPGSRGHVIREDMPALQATTIPSMEKLIGKSKAWKWHRSSSDYYVEYKPNGSRIYFVGESISSDPELNDFLGLETNWILLEQLEGLSEKLFNIALSRVGSWYLPKMPAGIIMETFNPTQTWVKKKRYLPWREGKLPEYIHYQMALPKDNPFVTNDQWAAWGMMDERYQRQFIEGDWTNFDDGDNRWAFAFSREKHVVSAEEWTRRYKTLVDPNELLYLSWDFNRQPMVCTVIQWPQQRKQKVCKVYKLKNMGVDGICERILADFPNMLYIVTGDYSGDTDTTMFEEEVSNYTIIQNKLQLTDAQLQITPNPRLHKNRTLCNTLLTHYPIEIHETEAEPLIFDMENVKANADGSIDKGKSNERKTDPTKQADTLDTWRYFNNKFLSDWINIPES